MVGTTAKEANHEEGSNDQTRGDQFLGIQVAGSPVGRGEPARHRARRRGVHAEDLPGHAGAKGCGSARTGNVR